SLIFFFSSRRRHTRWPRDWSSDVCSSDLTSHGLVRDAKGNFWFDINPGRRSLGFLDTATQKIAVYETPASMSPVGGAVTMDVDRSEERRVGKECRCRWWACC